MNIKLKISEVEPLLDKKIPEQMVYKLLKPLADNAGLLFSEPVVGTGYLQWDLPGKGWISFSDADETQKAAVAQAYQQRKTAMRAAMTGSTIEQAVFTIPSEKFIFFRPKGNGWEIAVTAWGHKFPNQNGGGELDTWISKAALQDVRISFTWDGNNIPGFAFKLNGMHRHTLADGWYEMDGKLPIGSSYSIEPHTGGIFTLTVEEGRAEYVYDLTRYAKVNITVLKDDIPMNGCSCEIAFNGIHTVTTDSQGAAEITIPMVCDETGMLLPLQPECTVSCMEEKQQAVPDADNAAMDFVFRFKSELPPPVPPIPGPLPPDPDPDPEPEPEPENVYILLQDYGGFPLPDLDFTLITKKKGSIQLRTDSEGACIVPKEWFTHKERIKVKFKISPEYQEKHDLHDKKSKKK